MAELPSHLVAALADRYRLERRLGEGGMATVYLAHDLKHDRKVALKVLRPELAAVLGAERFLKEITVTANLQHPNILPLYDSGSAAGRAGGAGGPVEFLYYAMPYLEGESLRDRLEREGQLGVDAALAIAQAVAGALQYAHERGVLHRDIKPDNVLFQAGQPIMADFGIALAISEAGGTRLTESGLSLGTPSCMSPEQVTGERTLDARSDVYALASMLYEMLVGEPPHVGNSVQAVIGKILADDPVPVSRRRRTVPAHVDAAITKALEKMPADRHESAAAFAAALSDERSGPHQAAARGAARFRTSAGTSPRTRWVAAAGLVLLGAAAAWLLTPVPRSPARLVTRFTVPVTAGQRMAEAFTPNVALSPDGRTLVYATDAGMLVRPLGGEETRLVPGTEGACCPVVSPDGAWVAFVQGSRARRAALDGGQVVDMTLARVPESAVWPDPDFLIAGDWGQGIARLPVSGGAAEPLTRVDSVTESAHLWPQLLPDRRHLLYTTMGPGMRWNGAKVVVQDLESGARTVVAEEATFGRYVRSGYVAYVRADGTVEAVPFDLRRREVTGTPVVVTTGVRTSYWGGAAALAVSDSGTLAFVRGSSWADDQLVWRDRRGNRLGTVGRPLTPERFDLSRDGRSIVMYVASATADIYRMDLETGELRRLTFDESTEDNPIWSPDGRRVAYHRITSGQEHRIVVRALAGQDEPEVLYTGSDYVNPDSWSPDGRWLMLSEQAFEQGAEWTARALDLEGGDTVTVASPATKARFSPDGRWVAYASAKTGTQEIYIVSFPSLSSLQQISVDGGDQPRWAAGSGELFYRKGDSLMVTTVRTRDGLSWSPPRALFAMGGGMYAVMPDGQRILVAEPNPEAQVREIHVVLNWDEELKKR